jgi:translation initiation factor 3 subunit D
MAVEMEEGTWGPPSKEISIGLKELGIPYAPYAKADRFGKIADWIGPVARQQTQPRMRPNALIPGTGLGTGASSTQPAATARPGQPSMGASDDSDQPDSEYTFVDTRPAPRTKGWQQRGAGRAQSGRFPPGSSGRSQQGPQPQSGAAAVAATGAWGSGPPGQRGAGGGAGRGDGRGRGQQQQQGGRGFQGDRRENAVQYSPSVEVRPEWNVLEQVQLSQLTKLSYDVKEAEDLKTCGRLRKYNKVLDRITPRAERRLQRFQGVEFPNPTASDDPYLQELSDLDEGSVFITDSVLAAIMCATRSVFSWDIVITKSGSKLWFDKRRKSKFEQLTVHETAQLGSQLEEGYDSINRVQPLCEEATITNANFSQMALDENSPVQELEDEAPFIDASKRDNTAPKAYRYRRWKLEEGVSVVVRTEIDCLCELRGEDVYSLAKSVNEFDPRVRTIIF